MIDVNKIIREFEENEDDENIPTEEELGIDQNQFKEPSKNLAKELKELGADLDWWMGDKTKHEQGIMELGADPPEVSVKRVSDMLDIDYSILIRLVQEKMHEKWSIIVGTLKEDEDVEELKEDAEDLTEIESLGLTDALGLAGKLGDIQENLQAEDPMNKMKWVAILLKEHGEKEVSIRRWFRAHWFFDRILKAETVRKTKEKTGSGILEEMLHAILGGN